MTRQKTMDEQIAEDLAHSERSGELRSAPSWGKPLDFGDGYEQTPPELRMGFKILKDAGVVPPTVEAMQRIAERQLAQAGEAEAPALRQRITDLQQTVALQLEKLASSRSL